MHIINWLKKLMPVILVNLLKKHIIVVRSMRLKVKYLSLPTTAALNAVENKIPNVSGLVDKTDYDAKILKVNILPHPIIINLQVIHFMQT